jgi:hypothetical protein
MVALQFILDVAAARIADVAPRSVAGSVCDPKRAVVESGIVVGDFALRVVLLGVLTVLEMGGRSVRSGKVGGLG